MNEQKTSWTPWDERDDLPKAVLKTVVWDGNLHKWYMDISPVGRLPEELYDELVKGWDLIKFIADKFSYSCGCSEPDNLQPRRYTEEEKERGKRLFEIRHFLPTMDVEGKERGKLLFEIVKESDLSADEYNRMLHEHPEPYDVVIKELKILEKIKRREYIALHGDIIETSNCTDENPVQPNKTGQESGGVNTKEIGTDEKIDRLYRGIADSTVQQEDITIDRIPEIDIDSKDWVDQQKFSKLTDIKIVSLKQYRNRTDKKYEPHATKNEDGTAGIDKQENAWRKSKSDSRKVYYYLPFCESYRKKKH